jgi:hypothetical protein
MRDMRFYLCESNPLIDCTASSVISEGSDNHACERSGLSPKQWT